MKNFDHWLGVNSGSISKPHHTEHSNHPNLPRGSHFPKRTSVSLLLSAPPTLTSQQAGTHIRPPPYLRALKPDIQPRYPCVTLAAHFRSNRQQDWILVLPVFTTCLRFSDAAPANTKLSGLRISYKYFERTLSSVISFKLSKTFFKV